MTTLNINGQHVTVDDSFLSLSPEEQHSTVEEIASHLTPAEPVSVNNVARSAATGVPIVGGLLNKADAATNAALSYPLNSLFDEKDQLTGTFGERYEHSLRDQEGADAKFASQHPVIDTGAKIAGGVASMVPVVAAAPGLLGASGSFGGRVVNGAISNAAIGGADSAARGEGPVNGAITGGVLGAAAPVVEAAASPFISQIRARLNPEGFARNQVARAIHESGRTADQLANDVTQAAAEGQPQFTLADALGKPGQDMLSTVARAPGQGGTDVATALNDRQAGQGRRVSNALSEGFGSRMTPDQLRDAMTADRGAIADQEYGAVRNDAQPVEVQNVIDHIDANVPAAPAAPDTISGRLQRYRRMLTNGDEENPTNLTEFEHVQRVRSELSDEIQNAHQTRQGNRARMLGSVLTRLDQSLEDASPGFRQANANFRQASRNIDAIDAGRDAFNRGRTEDTLPAFNSLTPRGQQAFRAGYVDPAIAQTQGAAFGVNKARPLINDAFRDEAAAIAPNNEQMQRRIAREQTMFTTRERALGGSKTADNLANHEALGINPTLVMHLASGNLAAAAGNIVHAGVRGVTGNTPAVRKAVADILLRNGTNMTGAQLNQMVSRTIAQIQFIQTMTRGSTAAAATTTNANRKTPIFARTQ